MSLAFGWFLLIAVGWIETVAYLGFRYVPLQGHVFFKYFSTGLQHKPVFDFLMDLLLLFVLSGVTLAFGKRIYSQAMGMHRTTRHVLGDRIALSVLWLIFPAACWPKASPALCTAAGISHGYDRRVDGASCQSDRPADAVRAVVVGLFDLSGAIFIVLPFSRYMHIFTEIP